VVKVMKTECARRKLPISVEAMIAKRVDQEKQGELKKPIDNLGVRESQ
jgi:hypothetical protein